MTDPPHNKDKVIADTGWGIKPDDQPANAKDAGEYACNEYVYDASDPQAIRHILAAQRRGFNTANRVVVEPGRTVIYDINKDPFVVRGLTYGDDNLIELLKNLGAAFDPQQLRAVPADDQDTREYDLSRVWAWGAERTG